MRKFPIVGMRHHGVAAFLVTLLPMECPLRLVREPENPYDANAIQVWVDNSSDHLTDEDVLEVLDYEEQNDRGEPELGESVMLGFIPMRMNSELADALDAELAAGRELPPARLTTREGQPALEIGVWGEDESGRFADFTEEPEEEEQSSEDLPETEASSD